MPTHLYSHKCTHTSTFAHLYLLIHVHINHDMYVHHVCVCTFFHMQGQHPILFDLQLAFVGIRSRWMSVHVPCVLSCHSYPCSQLWKTWRCCIYIHNYIYIYIVNRMNQLKYSFCDSNLIQEHVYNIIQLIHTTSHLNNSRSVWILEFVFIWQVANVHEKHWSRNSWPKLPEFIPLKSIAGLEKLQGMLVHDVGEGEGFCSPHHGCFKDLPRTCFWWMNN